MFCSLLKRSLDETQRSPAYSTGWTEYPPNGLKSSGAKTSSRGAFFADLALCPHVVRGDPPQGAKIASQAAHVDENRPIFGRLGRLWGGRESLIQGRCVPNGRYSHLYHGGDIRPLRAEYSEPSKGRGEEVASHLSAPRAAISARGSRGQRLPQVSPRACGITPTSPFF